MGGGIRGFFSCSESGDPIVGLIIHCGVEF